MISIIVPVYKAEKTLSRCVESLLAQTHGDFELLLIDDGSPDDSGKICDEHAKKDSRIKVVHQKNAGASAARNRGLDEARGEYIAFVDSDDWVAPTYLEGLLSALACGDGDLSMCNYTLIPPNGETSVVRHGFAEGTRLSADEIKKRFYRRIIDCDTGGFFALWNKLYRRELIEQGRLRMNSEMSFGEDMCFLLDCFEHSRGMAFTEKPLYFYELGEDGLFNRYRPSLLFDMMRCYEKNLSTVAGYHPEEKKFAKLNCKYFYYINRYLDGVVKNEKKKSKKITAVWKNPTVKKIFVALSSLSEEELAQNGISEYELKVPKLVLKKRYFEATEYAKYQIDETHWIRRMKNFLKGR